MPKYDVPPSQVASFEVFAAQGFCCCWYDDNLDCGNHLMHNLLEGTMEGVSY